MATSRCDVKVPERVGAVGGHNFSLINLFLAHTEPAEDEVEAEATDGVRTSGAERHVGLVEAVDDGGEHQAALVAHLVQERRQPTCAHVSSQRGVVTECKKCTVGHVQP